MASSVAKARSGAARTSVGDAAQVLPAEERDGGIGLPVDGHRGGHEAGDVRVQRVGAGHELVQVREPVAVRVLLGPLLVRGQAAAEAQCV